MRFRKLVVQVLVLRILQFFVQAEAKPVLALVPHGQVSEDEVTSWTWTV
jgi:hypothetical protein